MTNTGGNGLDWSGMVRNGLDSLKLIAWSTNVYPRNLSSKLEKLYTVSKAGTRFNFISAVVTVYFVAVIIIQSERNLPYSN